MSGTMIGGSAASAGLFGKMPSFGDFVTRRLTSDFIASWDGWLQGAVAGSRQRLGERWLHLFLQAPIWRFLLTPGVINGSAWAGVLIPSVDRVGRYFPLTLAMNVGSEIDPMGTFPAASEWYHRLESLGFEALAPQLDFPAFDARLQLLPAPPVYFPSDREDETLPFPMAKTRFVALSLPDGLDGPEAEIRWRGVVQGQRAPFSLWSTGDNDMCGRMYLASEHLPSGELFCAMLDGAWMDHGWELVQMDAADISHLPEAQA